MVAKDVPIIIISKYFFFELHEQLLYFWFKWDKTRWFSLSFAINAPRPPTQNEKRVDHQGFYYLQKVFNGTLF